MESNIQNVNIDLVVPNRFQPRMSFSEVDMQNLTDSIKEHGIIQPIVVRRLFDKYEIVAGERRLKAAKAAGLTEVPVIVIDLSDNKSAEIALVENIQRKNLSPVEIAKSFKMILERENLTQSELAKKMGVSQSSIANKIRLLNLTEEVQNALLEEKISERHARSLLQLTDPLAQVNMLNRIVNERLTVRQLDDLIKGSNVTEEVPSETIAPTEPTNEFVSLDENVVNEPELENQDFVHPAELDEDDDEEEQDEATEVETKSEIFGSEKLFNILDKFTASETTDMEIEGANLQTFNDNLFVNKYPEEEVVEPVKVEVPKEPQVIVKEIEEFPIEQGNIESVKLAYAKLTDKVIKAGFKVSNEDFDFEDLYQMIIKIEKQAPTE